MTLNQLLKSYVFLYLFRFKKPSSRTFTTSKCIFPYYVKLERISLLYYPFKIKMCIFRSLITNSQKIKLKATLGNRSSLNKGYCEDTNYGWNKQMRKPLNNRKWYRKEVQRIKSGKFKLGDFSFHVFSTFNN